MTAELDRRPAGWVPLPDGSTFVVEGNGRQSMVSRHVGDECVWGQVFSASTVVDHEAQVRGVLDAMRVDPGAFTRRDLWDADGKAVTVPAWTP